MFGHRTNFNQFLERRNPGAATGRSLVRDLYADGEWQTYSQLCAIVPHGGSIGYALSHKVRAKPKKVDQVIR